MSWYCILITGWLAIAACLIVCVVLYAGFMELKSSLPKSIAKTDQTDEVFLQGVIQSLEFRQVETHHFGKKRGDDALIQAIDETWKVRVNGRILKIVITRTHRGSGVDLGRFEDGCCVSVVFKKTRIFGCARYVARSMKRVTETPPSA